MGFFEKVKNMFIEEVEEDEPIKKEVIQVKIPKPVVDDEEEDEEEEKEEKIKITKYDDEDEETEKNVISVIPEKKVSVPTYFDDDDFSDLKKDEEPVKKEIKKEEVKKHEYGQKRYEQPNIVKPNITGYNGKKEEPVKKVFQPTPIISPVYGVLDKNYKKEEITSKKKTETVNTTVNNDTNTVSVDDIRKKAFGTLEDDLEKTLIDKDAIMFTGPSNKKKEKVVKEKKEEVKVKNVVEEKKEEVVEDIGDEIDIFSVLEDEEDMNELEKLLNSYNFEEDNVEEKLNKDYDKYEKELNLDEKLENSDLFNLIDEMYEKKDGEQ